MSDLNGEDYAFAETSAYHSHEEHVDYGRPLTPDEQARLDRIAQRAARQMRTGTRQVIWANGEVETISYEVL